MGTVSSFNHSIFSALAAPIQSVVALFWQSAPLPECRTLTSRENASCFGQRVCGSVIFRGACRDTQDVTANGPADSNDMSFKTVQALATPPARLKVIRAVEPGQRTSSVGRMVISGSINEVCAELDRMARRERS